MRRRIVLGLMLLSGTAVAALGGAIAFLNAWREDYE